MRVSVRDITECDAPARVVAQLDLPDVHLPAAGRPRGGAEYDAVAESLHMAHGSIGPTRRCLQALRALIEQQPVGRVSQVARRHDHDVGGSRELLDAKAQLRDRVWSALREQRQARFPGAHGRIPNFVGAEAAADRLRGTEVWRRARTVKCNPDSPQWPVRQRALEDGKTVYMAVPRLADPSPFFLLDPADLADPPRQASSIKGASRSARRVGTDELEPVDLVVTGCVAAGRDGARLGKGGGFSDLEFAVATGAGLISERTTVVTTVHEQQVVAAGAIPTADHDIRLNLVVTPERVVECPGGRGPALIRWDELTEQKVAAIPLLGELRRSVS